MAFYLPTVGFAKADDTNAASHWGKAQQMNENCSVVAGTDFIFHPSSMAFLAFAPRYRLR